MTGKLNITGVTTVTFGSNTMLIFSFFFSFSGVNIHFFLWLKGKIQLEINEKKKKEMLLVKGHFKAFLLVVYLSSSYGLLAHDN